MKKGANAGGLATDKICVSAEQETCKNTKGLFSMLNQNYAMYISETNVIATVLQTQEKES